MFGFKNHYWVDLQEENILAEMSNNYAYEVIRLIESRPLFLDLHYERLVKTCQSLNIEPPQEEKMMEDIQKLIAINKLQNVNVKIALDTQNYAVFPIKSIYPSPENYLRGVSCAILYEERENPKVKAFQPNLREKSNRQISQQEIYESVLVNKEGLITEGSRSNLFFIKDQVVYTAPDHLVLAGITRMKILEICKYLNLSIFYKTISIKDLIKTEAAFICGTSPGVLPIKNIEVHQFDVQNSILRKIHNAYHSKYLSKNQL